jgi:hypothetical protein
MACSSRRIIGWEGVTDDTEVSAVNDAVTLLQMTFAELEADAANLPNEGLCY